MITTIVWGLVAVLLPAVGIVYYKVYRASRLKKMQRALDQQRSRPTIIFVPSANPFDRETPHMHIQSQTKRTHSRFWLDEVFDREMEISEQSDREIPDFNYNGIADYLIANTELEWHVRHM